MSCIFCKLPASRLVRSSDTVIVVRDAFPVSGGHTLVILRRHVESYFDVTEEERAGMWDEVARVRSELDAEVHPDGYTVGVNVGVAGGQTVMHVHIHVIPRYTGDVPDPRGGIRGVIPGKRTYGDSE